MNAISRRSKLLRAVAAVVLSSGVCAWVPHIAASEDKSRCTADCIEVIEDGEVAHALLIDAAGNRHHLSTFTVSPNTVILPGAKNLAQNVKQIPLDLPADNAKLAGCGDDGYGWNFGEVMWTTRLAESNNGSGGSSRTDARSIYVARGSSLVTTITTTFGPTGITTSVDGQEEMPASVKAGTPTSGCTQAK
jgi:hypothetical protein